MLKLPDFHQAESRRDSVASTSSSQSQSGFQGGSALKTPTISSIGRLAGERENMQTPRPQMQNSSETNTEPSPSQIDNRFSSEKPMAVIDNNVASNSVDEKGRISSEYPSNFMSRPSFSSVGHVVQQQQHPNSEYGERPTTSSSVRKNRKKTVAPPEMLVIVRPPPSKQVNPLNLQIQLVIPQVQSGTVTSRASTDSSRDDHSIPASASLNSNGMTSSNSSNSNALSTPNTPVSARPLQRSSSINSSRSARSDVSSSVYSNASSNSANRRVTPLYNLNFHNITATTVTDAGTDEKIAKFGKRGVEIDGFGLLEPRELLLGVNDLSTLMMKRNSPSRGPTTIISSNSDNEATSIASRGPGVDLSRGDPRFSSEEPPTSFDAMSPEAKNPSDGSLGGKFLSKFKRFSMGAGQNLGGKLGTMGAPSASSIRLGTTNNEATPSSLLAKMTSVVSAKNGEALADDRSDVISRIDSISGPYSLGQSLGVEVPQLIAGGGLRSDTKRTEGYYWTVRKWNRRSTLDEEDDRDRRLEEPGSNPILNSVWKRFNMVNRMGGQEIHPHCSEVPVRFEWTRNSERRKSSVVSSGHAKSAIDSATRSKVSRLSFGRASMDVKSSGEASTTTDSADVFRSNLRPPPKSGQNSRPSSVYSNSSARHRGSMDANSQVGSTENYQEDSDPEDSEVSWSCHLVLGPTTRIPIGSLSPTPHHPKLIGQLSIPFPLPDLSQSGLGVDGAGLTREELKDIINITCLFVVVREGFGGLIKKKRVQGNK